MAGTLHRIELWSPELSALNQLESSVLRRRLYNTQDKTKLRIQEEVQGAIPSTPTSVTPEHDP